MAVGPRESESERRGVKAREEGEGLLRLLLVPCLLSEPRTILSRVQILLPLSMHREKGGNLSSRAKKKECDLLRISGVSDFVSHVLEHSNEIKLRSGIVGRVLDSVGGLKQKSTKISVEPQKEEEKR